VRPAAVSCPPRDLFTTALAVDQVLLRLKLLRRSSTKMTGFPDASARLRPHSIVCPRRGTERIVHVQRQTEDDPLDAFTLNHLEHARCGLLRRSNLNDFVRSRDLPAGVAERQPDAAGTEIDR
jgi:hypothetical protein